MLQQGRDDGVEGVLESPTVALVVPYTTSTLLGPYTVKP
jgi:hypothetical protein